MRIVMGMIRKSFVKRALLEGAYRVDATSSDI